MSDEESLNRLLAKAKARWESMTPEERDAEMKAQRESWVRAEASWPKAKYRWVNGVKVYDSYEDYIND